MCKSLIIFSIVWFITTCNTSKSKPWADVKVDPDISNNAIYQELNKQKEIFSFGEKEDSLMKRTSDVAYLSGEKINRNDLNQDKFNNCRIFYTMSDTLYIHIGIGNGFGAYGFIITYSNNKFHTKPFYVDDIVSDDEVEPTYTVVYQKLTLDKTKYGVGDSLYGKIEFKSIETNTGMNNREHFAIGYFRGKVKTPEYPKPN